MWTCQNNIGFSLYAVLSVYCIVTASEKWMKSKIEMSTDWVYYYKTSGIEFNRGYLYQLSDQ